VVARLIFPPAFCLAQRARAAAASLARVAADILRLPALPALGIARAAEPPTIELRRLSRLSICRRIETASSKDLRDKSIRRLIAAVE